jgi:hypothetical protein
VRELLEEAEQQSQRDEIERRGQRTVPDVSGLPLAQAREVAGRSDLQLSAPGEAVAGALVPGQAVQVGTPVARGSSVTVSTEQQT